MAATDTPLLRTSQHLLNKDFRDFCKCEFMRHVMTIHGPRESPLDTRPDKGFNRRTPHSLGKLAKVLSEVK